MPDRRDGAFGEIPTGTLAAIRRQLEPCLGKGWWRRLRVRHYKVVYELEPDGSAWNVSIPDLPGVFTWAASIRKAREHARESIALWLDVDELAVNIEEEEYVVPAPVRKALERARRARERSDTAQRNATAAARDAARILTESAGLTLRDSGVVLGLSYQRVDQLLRGSRTTGSAG